MTVVVRVCEADLRGVPFREYAAVLGNLIGEMYAPDDTAITPGERTGVLLVDPDGSVDPGDVLDMARDITTPEFRDGIFG